MIFSSLLSFEQCKFHFLFFFYFCFYFLFQKLNWCGWTFVLISMPAIIFADYQSHQFNPIPFSLQYALYETFGRILWSIAVCYVILACTHDGGGVINTFLSLPMWQPISKLSYCIYLIHFTIIGILSIKTPLYFNEITAFQNFISYFVLSIFVAIPLVLAFELPIDAIHKIKFNAKNEK